MGDRLTSEDPRDDPEKGAKRTGSDRKGDEIDAKCPVFRQNDPKSTGRGGYGPKMTPSDPLTGAPPRLC